MTSTLKFTATGIWRKTNDFINNVIDGSLWQPVTLTNQLTNQPFTAYRWANSAATSENFFIRNTEGFRYSGHEWQPDRQRQIPRRNYKGLMLLLDKSFRTDFGYQLSYVLSKAEGTVDNRIRNTGWAVPSGISRNSPNASLSTPSAS